MKVFIVEDVPQTRQELVDLLAAVDGFEIVGQTGSVREVTVKELHVERKIRLLYAKARTLSHAAKAFLDLVADA